MVENGVREEINHLKDRIVKTRAYFLVLKDQIQIYIQQIAFFKSAQKYYSELLAAAKGTNEEREAQECVKNVETWLKKYEEMRLLNEEAIKANKAELEKLEKRLKELRE
jgi:protein subunit release factor A